MTTHLKAVRLTTWESQHIDKHSLSFTEYIRAAIHYFALHGLQDPIKTSGPQFYSRVCGQPTRPGEAPLAGEKLIFDDGAEG